MKIACIVQRYGDQIVGGAELHCRLVAERLAAMHSVEILTTCATDYLTWENVLPEGIEQVGPCTVRRFPVSRPRPPDFDDLAFRVLHSTASSALQMEYLEAHGPFAPSLVEHLANRPDIDAFIFFSYRYWITCNGVERAGDRSILVPTAEHDRAIYLDVYHNVFRKASQIAFNSIEEKELIGRATGMTELPGEIIGVGLPDVPPSDFTRLVDRYDLDAPYMVYIGRIERSKGCAELVGQYLKCADNNHELPQLVLIGKQHIPIPDHSKIRCLGILPEDLKLAVLQNALFLIMPSRYESLSMVLLEAWRMRRPVMVNGNCDVLRGQCLRSQGGLYYRNYDQFAEVMHLMCRNDALRERLGDNGFRYYQRNYSWDVILNKYSILIGRIGDRRGAE